MCAGCQNAQHPITVLGFALAYQQLIRQVRKNCGRDMAHHEIFYLQRAESLRGMATATPLAYAWVAHSLIPVERLTIHFE